LTKGNTHFKSSTNRTPRYAEKGFPGDEKNIIIDLKLIADIGLVGFPNAGKSTLISKISAAKPKIADYPFTTLVPNLGIVKYHEYDSFVVADIPGIIKGASDGKGLGLQFLRHIERTKVLLFMIDSMNITDKKVLKEYEVLLKELENYSEELLSKPRLICFTKVDMISEELKKKLVLFSKRKHKKEIPASMLISSITGENLDKLKDKMFELITKANEE
jgi:GTP-binding protein